jgi:putative ABC transport system permease protein
MLITRFDAMSVQLAVLRAIGYGRREIGMWLIWEGFLLGLAGCLVGMVIDGSTFPILRDLLGSALPPADLIASSFLESYPVWIVTVPATVFAIFIPLIRLYRQDVHQALKG